MIKGSNPLGKHTFRMFVLVSAGFFALHNAFIQSKNVGSPARPECSALYGRSSLLSLSKDAQQNVSKDAGVNQKQPQLAVCISPIADVLGGPVPINQLDLYETQPCADNLCGLCKRIDQILFNDVVEVQEVRDNGKQVRIKLPGKVYETRSSNKQLTDGWVAGKDLQFGTHGERLPKPLTLNPAELPTALKNTVALKEPYPIPGTNDFFSVGTRFVIRERVKNAYDVWWLNPKTKKLDTLRIPLRYCLPYHEKLTNDQRRHLMVDMARNVIKRTSEVAYVWGGCSLAATCYDRVEMPATIRGELTFDREQNSLPRTGYDCSGLITRMANMAGLYMPYKNSYTIAKRLPEVTTIHDLKIGDVIWIPGHVMMVSSLDKNLLIEARHYMHGYGRVQEIPLEEEFAGIKTYGDLLAAIQNKQPVMRKDRDGNKVQKLTNIKLLSIA